jgi:hypothetical protein
VPQVVLAREPPPAPVIEAAGPRARVLTAPPDRNALLERLRRRASALDAAAVARILQAKPSG